MRAAIYVRISSDRDADEVSVDNQRLECEAFAKQRGWEIGKVYVDNDLSATTGVERPGFEALLNDKPEAVVCWHTDRLVRVTSDLERVISLGVNIHAVRAGHLDLSTPAGRAVARTVTAWATYEGEQRTERQRLSNRNRALRGEPNWPTRPFGHNPDGTPHPTEAPLVAHWARAILAGSSMGSLLSEANRKGILTVRGKAWTYTSFKRLLEQPRLAGIATYNGEEVGPGNWEPLLDEGTWRAVVAQLETRARAHPGRRVAQHFLSGVAKCGICMQTVVAIVSNGETAYRCRTGKHVTRRKERVDHIVQRTALEVLTQPAAVEAILGGENEQGIEDLRSELAILRGRLDDATAAYASGVLTIAQLTTISGEIGAQIEAAENALAMKAKNSPLGSILKAEDVVAEWGALPEEVQREVVRLLFDVLIVPTRPGRSPKWGVEIYPAGTGRPVDQAVRA